MKKVIVFLILMFILTSCEIYDTRLENNNESNLERQEKIDKDLDRITSKYTPEIEYDLINEEGKTVSTRIREPKNFKRVPVESNSFGEYLRELPLKPHGSKVSYYNGVIKPKDVHVAVIDMDVGERDLQQCADAIIRLRAEYLFSQQMYDKIHFNFTNGFKIDYPNWIKGKRVTVEGNNCHWVQKTGYSNTYKDLRKYLNMVFAYAGTLSLEKELETINPSEINIGDVIIQGGSPGHAVTVIDIAENIDSGKKIFMLAQSYMPAQDIHILKNPMNNKLSPWYELDFGEQLYTPEWVFNKNDFKRFK